MLLSDVAIKRPVFGIVLSLLLVIFGLISFSKMSVREMPEVENPVVTISTNYTIAITGSEFDIYFIKKHSFPISE